MQTGQVLLIPTTVSRAAITSKSTTAGVRVLKVSLQGAAYKRFTSLSNLFIFSLLKICLEHYQCQCQWFHSNQKQQHQSDHHHHHQLLDMDIILHPSICYFKWYKSNKYILMRKSKTMQVKLCMGK